MDKLRQSNRFALIFYLLFLALPLALDPLCLLLFPNADPVFTLDIVFYASFPLIVGIFLLCVLLLGRRRADCDTLDDFLIKAGNLQWHRKNLKIKK